MRVMTGCLPGLLAGFETVSLILNVLKVVSAHHTL